MFASSLGRKNERVRDTKELCAPVLEDSTLRRVERSRGAMVQMTPVSPSLPERQACVYVQGKKNAILSGIYRASRVLSGGCKKTPCRVE